MMLVQVRDTADGRMFVFRYVSLLYGEDVDFALQQVLHRRP